MTAIRLNEEKTMFIIPCGGGFTTKSVSYVQNQIDSMVETILAHKSTLARFLGQIVEYEQATIQQYNAYMELLSEYAKLPAHTFFSHDTPKKVRTVIESCRKKGNIVRVFFGNPETGVDSMDEFETIGRIGRSNGIMKAPLLVPEGEHGGSQLSTSRILKIVDMESGETLYKNKNYKVPEVTIGKTTNQIAIDQGYIHEIESNGVLQGVRFKEYSVAAGYIAFITGVSNFTDYYNA